MTTILIVDTRPTDRQLYTALLGSFGYRVLEAGDGSEALELARTELPDLVITDIIMPGMEGIETIRTLRRTHPELKVIAMSGGGRMKPESYLEVAKAFGAVRVFSKPFDNEELFAAIEDALE